MPRGTLTPQELARAYRAENPRLFDDIDDTTLLKALKDEDPETFGLMDPLLEGSELLPGGAGARIPKVTGFPKQPVAPPPMPTSLMPTALRMGGSLGGAAIGTAVAPGVGTAAGGFAGGTAGEAAAQWWEKNLENREAYSPGTMLLEGGLSALNPAARGATIPARIASQAAFGSALNMVGGAGRTQIEEGHLPTAGEVAKLGLVGAMFGGAIHGGVEAVGAGVRAGLRRVGDTSDLTGRLPGGGSTGDPIVRAEGPPTEAGVLPVAGEQIEHIGQYPPGREDFSLGGLAQQVHQAELAMEEEQLVQQLQQTLQTQARAHNLTTALELKGHLEGLARLQQQKLLPAGPPGGIPSAERPMQVFPPDAQLELVGSQAPDPSRIIGGQLVGEEVPSQGVPGIANFLETSLQAPPGPPRLINDALALTPPPSVEVGSPPPPLPRLRAKGQQGAVQQGSQMGGRTASRAQPRLPETDRPVPLDERPYATGPNAGPRRSPSEELHGVLRKRVRYEAQPDGKTKRVVEEGGPPAEDPGTYPPEVRREMAVMAEELRAFKHEEVQGGSTPAQLEAIAGNQKVGRGGSISEAIATGRQSGAFSGGAMPGAPVYHEVIHAAGAYKHITRAEMLQQLEEALLEGKGTGLTDAAAQVARGRLKQRGGEIAPRRPHEYLLGQTEPGHTIIFPEHEGDKLIRWVDEEGIPSRPLHDLSPAEQAAREASDGELLGADRVYREGPVSEETEEFFQAAREEAVRRGLIDPDQPGLPMEGPGGAGGPSLLDFEGEPPKKPTVAEPSLPGLEGVRGEERGMPEVAEVPFALTPPAAKPSAGKQSSLFERLKSESGVLILDIPEGDRTGLRKWLAANEKEHGGEAWYSRAEQAMDDGEWAKAWKHAAGASSRSYMAAVHAADTPEQEQALRQLVRGTPFQDTIETQIVAQQRARAGVGTAPPVKGFPPSPHVTQAGAARGKATLGPAGILNPGPRQKPLSSIAPETRAATLDRSIVRLIMEGIQDPEGLAVVPGNQDTYNRLFRQVGDRIYQGKDLQLLREAGISISPQELAQHWNATISDAGRTLQLLRAFTQTHAAALEEGAARMDFGGALARGGRLGKEPPVYVGKGRGVLSPAGQKATEEVAAQIAKETNVYHANAFKNALLKSKAVSTARALHDSSYPFMLAQWKTAVRNHMMFTARYTVDSLNHALTAGYETLLQNPERARAEWTHFRERGLVPLRRGAAAPFQKSPGALALRSWGDTLQHIFDMNIEGWNSLPAKDVRRTLELLLNQPDRAAHFLGSISGEDLSTAFINTPVLRHLTDPKVHRYLTQFSRAMEYSGRAMVFDASVRAQLRIKGVDPNRVLMQKLPQVVQAAGGQEAFDRILFTATSHAMEATFAGALAKNSAPAAIVNTLNKVWPVKLAFPFPKFNFSAAPRWLYEETPAALLDWIRFPLDRRGITATKGKVSGGRLYRGVRAQEIQQTELPLMAKRIAKAEQDQGEALQDLLRTQQTYREQDRHIRRLLKREQQGLPGAPTQLEAVQAKQQVLEQQRDRLKTTLREQGVLVKDLKSQQGTLLDHVEDAIGINAPNYAQSLARMTSGAGLLTAAWIMRAQSWSEGTKWHQMKIDRGPGEEPYLADLRPYSPIAQNFLVADVIRDFYHQTDWAKVHEELEGGDNANPFLWADAMWRNYEGKYTADELGSQFGAAFLSISRASGTTLTLAELMTQNGWPSLPEAGKAALGTFGQWASRYAIPFGMSEAIPGLSSAFPEEAKVRTPPKATMTEWTRPLAAPLANIPGAKQLIPERISQKTGRPVSTALPSLRGLAGVGVQTQDFISAEEERIGLPGGTRFIRETGDVFYDHVAADSFARVQQEILPQIYQSEVYKRLRTPARQRDFLQRYVYPPMKQAALAEARQAMTVHGPDAARSVTMQGEDLRRYTRQQRMMTELEQEVGPGEELPDLPEGPGAAGTPAALPEVPARPF